MAALTRISAHCWVATSSFCAMNTVVVCGSGGAAVIDPGVTGVELDELVAGLAALGVGRRFGISTHPDWDHLLWHAGLGDVPRYASGRAVAWLNAERLGAARAEAAPAAPGADLELLGQVVPLPSEESIEWAGPTLRLVVHEAHAPGHLGVGVAADGVLVAGDMLSDIEEPLLDARATDPVGDYVRGLDALERAAQGCDVLVPGHGGMARGAEIAARIRRDRTILAGRAHRRPTGAV